MNLEYFKNKDFKLLFDSLKEKYIKTSKLVGVINILPNSEEANKISRLIGKNIKPNIINTIKIKDIETSINISKYEGTTILEILEYLYGNITTKKELKESKENNRTELLNDLINNYKDTLINSWLTENLNKDKVFYKKTIHLLEVEKLVIYNIFNAIIRLPINHNTYENLSVFASIITKDPHYFDLDTKNSSYFLWYLSKFLNINYDKTRKSAINVLNESGIYIDNYSNYVITYNLLGDEYLNFLQKRNEVALLSLDNINMINKVYAKNNKIIILENPSILTTIKNIKTDSAFIITSGNPNLAFYKLVDNLNNHNLYYQGDFDPEGLLIAEKLKNKYNNIEFINYNIESFNKSLSNKLVSESRLKKLAKVNCKELALIKEEIIKTKKVGYQEKIIGELIDL